MIVILVDSKCICVNVAIDLCNDLKKEESHSVEITKIYYCAPFFPQKFRESNVFAKEVTK